MSHSNLQQAEATHQPLLGSAYLRSVWADDYAAFRESQEAKALVKRINHWAAKHRQKETTAESTLIDVFFKETWGYSASGQRSRDQGYTLQPRYPVKNAGQKGGTGEADIALGYFGRSDREDIPQVFGEFKDARSSLDKEQNRSNRRSPVDQCFDYLREARAGRVSKILPTWALVTNMNEFRLYVYGNKAQYQRFVITPEPGDPAVALTDVTDEATFQRFVFSRVFHVEWLLASSGKSALERLLGEQLTHERTLEADFYKEYHTYRQHLFETLRQHNPAFEAEGRLRRLLGLTQRLLDRFIFVLYCEDMGRTLHFPPNLVRDVLIEVASSKFYHEDSSQAWDAMREFFAAMRDGGPFGEERIHAFNGGLFAPDPELDTLRIPNSVFCAQNQGDSPERLLASPQTLLFFSAKYNFGAADGRLSSEPGRTLTLTTMGRIFEQSITDLEIMEARAAGRESLVEITRRKRDGVYYTPEWVTKYIVEETVGSRLREIRAELGFERIGVVTDQQIAENREDRRRAPVVKNYEKALHAYSKQLDDLKVVDPACGSGAFLIQAFRFLYDQRQWVASELERVTRTRSLFDTHQAMRAVLANNLYGVDINAESTEITQLALWLHTALPERPLTSLDDHIRCGNSLVDTDFCEQLDRTEDSFSAQALDWVNPFNWQRAFPEVFQGEDPGFDCVIGNPPYVKLQNFRRVLKDVADYLLTATKPDRNPRYESTQTGNFDLFLPFIERGVELLNAKGKLGFIAPSTWMVNEYGEGLRRFVKQRQSLDRWIDFKSYQVFDDAITYTALQFFSGEATPELRCGFAPQGPEDVAAVSWLAPQAKVAIDDLDPAQAWELMPRSEQVLRAKLRDQCLTLEQSCRQIAVGVQTSADHIYHLMRIGPGRYLHSPRRSKETFAVLIEDEIMRPLISGAEATRYEEPRTDTYLLFPYRIADGKAKLIPAKIMAASYPLAWAYLQDHEATLRARERGKFDDDTWYRFGRNQNIDKQHLTKLMVPRLVYRLFATLDRDGSRCLDNVDVNGVLLQEPEDAGFLLGVINAPVMNWVWRRTSKPFQNDYRAANKQFIAPLPVPRASDVEKADVARQAEALQALHTQRRDLCSSLDRRLASKQCEDDARDESWLWADVKSIKDLKALAPAALGAREKTRWAREERARRLAAHLDGLDTMLQVGAELTVQCDDGELGLLINGVPAIEGIFLDKDDADFVTAQWSHAVRDVHVTEKFDGKRLVRKLLASRRTGNQALARQVVELARDIAALDVEIAAAERAMNARVYSLYGLTDDEICLVEAG